MQKKLTEIERLTKILVIVGSKVGHYISEFNYFIKILKDKNNE